MNLTNETKSNEEIEYKNLYFINDDITNTDFRKKYHLDTLIDNLNCINLKYNVEEKKKVKFNC